VTDDEGEELVQDGRTGLWEWKSRKEINNNPKIVKEDIRDWVIGDDGKSHDTKVGEKWVKKK